MRILSWLLRLTAAFILLQTLFFKFTGSKESIFIFSTLRDWSGISLFEPAGRWIIGSAELIASVLLFIPRVRIFGAAMAIGIMTGAISFHLFTPLGVVILGDGGELFTLACGVWLSGWAILALSAGEVRGWIGYYGAFYRSELHSLAWRIDQHLLRWAMQKFKRLRGKIAKADTWLDTVRLHYPRLFAHWHLLAPSVGRPVGAV